MKIGILQTGRAPNSLMSKHGDYDEMSRIFLGLSPKNVRHYAVLDGEFPDSPADCDGWLITGSRHGVYEDHDWIAPLEAFIRYAYAEGSKMVGICFGHQIIAKAMGGKVEKFDKGFSVGAVDYTPVGSLKEALISSDTQAKQGNADTLRLHAYHQDQILTPPKGAETILTSDFCQYAGLSYGGWGLTVQPHPEFLGDYIEDLIKIRKGSTLSEALTNQALESLSLPAENRFQIVVQDFLGIS